MNNTSFAHPKYRPDIDGLRAIAVLSVVLFHAFPKALKGGFTGVDIFFVISGFLISTIIFENLERQSFSFTEFYARRVRRIFPALVLVLTASFGMGWFFLLADEYRLLGKHIAAGAGFISNYILWSESGYFDTAAETKPLLHLWSLGIEEQFYIVWPLLVWLIWKNRWSAPTVIGTALVASFAWSLYSIHLDQTAAFYSPLTRFWELLCGSALAWHTLHAPPAHSNPVRNNILSGVGLVFLLVSILVVRKSFAFPGGWALLPTLGTTLLIAAGSDAWINRHILTTRIMVSIGLISYPLYLWHWPLLTFARIAEGGIPAHTLRWTLLLSAGVLAWATYRFLERPIRFSAQQRNITQLAALSMILVGIGGGLLYVGDGLKFRARHQFYEENISYFDSIKTPPRQSECFEIPHAYDRSDHWFCALGDTQQPSSLFAYGDSHALSLIPALDRYGHEYQRQILFTGTSGCPSLLGIQSLRGEDGIKKYNCQKLNERIFDYVHAHGIKHVLLINRWTYYTGSVTKPDEIQLIARNPIAEATRQTSRQDLIWGLAHTISRYREIGVRVSLVFDNPQQLVDPKDAFRRAGPDDVKINQLAVSRQEHIKNQSDINAILEQQGVRRLNFDDVLCNTTRCPLVRDRKFLYSDDDHLSVEGSELVYPAMAQWLTTEISP